MSIEDEMKDIWEAERRAAVARGAKPATRAQLKYLCDLFHDKEYDLKHWDRARYDYYASDSEACSTQIKHMKMEQSVRVAAYNDYADDDIYGW